jgi:hypothetical protein
MQQFSQTFNSFPFQDAIFTKIDVIKLGITLDNKMSFIAFGQLRFTLLQEGLMVVED